MVTNRRNVFVAGLEIVVSKFIAGKLQRWIVLVASAVCLWTSEAAALDYSVTQLPFAPNGINSMGQVVGNFGTWTPTTPNGTTGSVGGGAGVAINDYGQTTRSDGQFDYLFTPSAPNGNTGTTTVITSVDRSDFTSVSAISNNGAVTGIYNPGIQTALNWLPDSPNGTTGANFAPQIGDGSQSNGAGINTQHQLVGSEIDFTHNYSGAYLFTPSGPLGSGVTTPIAGGLAVAINNPGQVVSEASPIGQAYLFTPTTPNATTGSTITLGFLSGATTTIPTALNDLGQVVGNSGANAFLWTTSLGIVNLNNYLDPLSGAGWTLQHATGINSAGQIVGTGVFGGTTQGFLLTPVPEPSTLILAMLCGLSLLAYRRRFA